MIEQVRCPVCSASNAEDFLQVGDRFSVDDGEKFMLTMCSLCGMVYLNPRPVEIESGRYYQQKEYLPFVGSGQNRSLTGIAYDFGRRINLGWKRRLIDRYWRPGTAKGPGTILDVGCGTGEFLRAMQKGGWRVSGIERDENASSFARQKWSIHVHTSDYRLLDTVSQSFDVITLWHVLEHLYNPLEALNVFRAHLAKGGFLLLAVPNIGGIDAWSYGADWVALDVPRHVNHFSNETLCRLAKEAGFVIIDRRQLPFDPFFNAVFSEQVSAIRRTSSVLLWPFRFVRAFAVALLSLIGGSRLFSARYGATLVFVLGRDRG